MMHLIIALALPAASCMAGTGQHHTMREAAHAAFPGSAEVQLSDSLRAVYEGGQRWHEFYDRVDRRRELWVHTWTHSAVPVDLMDRAREAAGPWRILVITEPGCSDSANSIPYIARLAEGTRGLELRLVDSTIGRPWLEAHRSTDGRAATPTVLVLDEDYAIRGCWIEQPVALQAIWLPVVARGTMAEEIGDKMAWYADDEGRETLREFVEVLEGTQSGRWVCPGLQD